MTESEAIEKLKAYIECESKRSSIEGCNDGCIDCELAYLQGTSKEHIESVKIAIQALEKQMPKKPIKSEKQVVRYVNTYYCPICNLGITGTNIAKWCYHCGQKLDWGDDNGD
nr:MAG TPA: zinc-ribbon containing domain protein [Bacteriophage sp.]